MIKRVKSTASEIPSVQTLRQHLGRDPESANTEDSTWLAEIRAIKNIECFSPKLQFEGLANRKVTMNGAVPLDGSKATKGISPQVTLTKGNAGVDVAGRIYKRSRVE